MKNIQRIPRYTFLVMVCLCLPLLESVFAGTLWGLNWHSPMYMAQVSEQLRVLKLIFVLLGVMFLYIKIGKVSNEIGNAVARNFFISFGFILATLQVPLLCLGILFNGVLSSDLNYIHKEKTFNNHSIYVYTADPGAMGTANHYFYLKCQLPLNRYKLIEIAKLDWMYDFSFTVEGNSLIIADNKQVKNTHNFDLSDFNCKKN